VTAGFKLRLILLAVALLLATGCAPDRGTVTRTWSSFSSGKWTYWLCAKDDKGTEGCQQVPAYTFAARRTCRTCRTARPYVIPRSLGECLPCAYPKEYL
jgi:hypothetical protein